MEFYKRVEIAAANFKIDLQTEILLLGSCFVESMGDKFNSYMFNVDINPTGIIYNPLSMAYAIEMFLQRRQFKPDDLIFFNDKWISLSHHGSFSTNNQEESLAKINSRLTEASERIRSMDLLVMTWGTAWVYRHNASNMVVSNCHKIPDRKFTRFRLSVEEIVSTYRLILRELLQINPKVKIVLTVSPVRHWKDGAHGNQLSKAVLLLAAEQLTAEFKQIYYFPSYEIVLDELRDYRFYAEDMLHPSTVAIEYIWERLKQQVISPKIYETMNSIEKIVKELNHRPFDPDSPKYRERIKILQQQLQKIVGEERAGERAGRREI